MGPYARAWRVWQLHRHALGLSEYLEGSNDEMVDGIIDFLASAHEKEFSKWGPKTAFSALSGISFMHKIKNISLPITDYRIKMVKKGMTRLYGLDCTEAGKPAVRAKRRPLTKEMLVASKRSVVLWNGPAGLVPWYGLALSYFLLCRASELYSSGSKGVHEAYCLRRDSLTFYEGERRLDYKVKDKATHVSVLFKAHKGDQKRETSQIVMKGEALEILLELLRLGGDDLPMSAPLMSYCSGGRTEVVSRDMATKLLRAVVVELGFDAPGEYALHSGRIGAATYLSSIGCSPMQIMRQGRWKSVAFMEYLRFTIAESLRISVALAGDDSWVGR